MLYAFLRDHISCNKLSFPYDTIITLSNIPLCSKCREAVAFAKAESASYLSLEKIADKDIQLATPPRPGNRNQVTLDYTMRAPLYIFILSNRYHR